MISLDPTAPAAPYEQVRSQLAQQIADRSLPVGTRLPTVRALAAKLGLAVNTVARAYRELEIAGLVETRGRSGTFVSAAGERSREEARIAALAYVQATRKLGISSQEALAVVSAALDLPA